MSDLQVISGMVVAVLGVVGYGVRYFLSIAQEDRHRFLDYLVQAETEHAKQREADREHNMSQRQEALAALTELRHTLITERSEDRTILREHTDVSREMYKVLQQVARCLEEKLK